MAKKKDFIPIANQYSRDILSGKIDACEMVGLACQRYEKDARDQKWILSQDAANKVCRFSELMPHVKGRWASNPNLQDRLIVLQPWQVFCFTNIFAFLDPVTGFRRCRRAMIVVPERTGRALWVP